MTAQLSQTVIHLFSSHTNVKFLSIDHLVVPLTLYNTKYGYKSHTTAITHNSLIRSQINITFKPQSVAYCREPP